MCEVKTKHFPIYNMPEFQDTDSLALDVFPRNSNFISILLYTTLLSLHGLSQIFHFPTTLFDEFRPTKSN